MFVLRVQNVHEALHKGIRLLKQTGIREESRNGPVLRCPFPVATVYERPWERVIFWPERDANPFFHLYESLWMLAGRNDLKPLLRYVKTFNRFSDDGESLHGAYGERWWRNGQLRRIIEQLKKNPLDRRCVLQIWDTYDDMGVDSKDIPCNLTATFQIFEGKLNMVVFNRSNDIVWGAYGANAVHFSMLLEYVARMVGVYQGTYTQVSVNWHAYLDTFDKAEGIMYEELVDPYANSNPNLVVPVHIDCSPNVLESVVTQLLAEADGKYSVMGSKTYCWADMVRTMFQAHNTYSSRPAPERFQESLDCLASFPSPHGLRADWIVAGQEWIRRRYVAWQKKQDASNNWFQQ